MLRSSVLALPRKGLRGLLSIQVCQWAAWRYVEREQLVERAAVDCHLSILIFWLPVFPVVLTYFIWFCSLLFSAQSHFAAVLSLLRGLQIVKFFITFWFPPVLRYSIFSKYYFFSLFNHWKWTPERIFEWQILVDGNGCYRILWRIYSVSTS